MIRPTPGRRNAAPARPQPGAGIPPPVAPAQPQQFTPAAAAITASGLNPLVDSAVVLLTLVVQLRNTLSHPDAAGL
ncbi:MAG: type VI secretion system protein TssL, partial [Pseudomonadota bacterium]|nr:type VI secretion system protein TssL [Pseudomonadota bacterium]